MNDTVTVYWSPIVKGTANLFDRSDDLSELKYFDPIPVNRTLNVKKFLGPSASMCPAMTDEMTRTFAIKAPIDFYVLYDKDNQSAAFKYDYGDEFNKLYAGPPNDENIHQLRYPSYLWFSDEPELTMTSLPAYYEQNKFTKNCSILSGSFDISSWVRQWQVAFKFKDKPELDIRRGDVLLYYRINTNKRIRLIKFDSDNQDVVKMMERCLSFKQYKAKWFVPNKLAESYEAFHRHKMHKKMLEIVQANKYN